MKSILKDIKNREFQRVYLLYGEEAYLRQSYKNKLKVALCEGDTMNYQYFEGKNIDFAMVKDFADTMPFFADYRVVIIEDSGLFSQNAEEWAKYIPQIPRTTILIFVEEKVDKRNKLYKKVKDNGYIAEMKRPSEADLTRWIAGLAKQEGKQITQRAVEEFLLRTGDNMEAMKVEFEKLLSYVGERVEIYPRDVEVICTERVTNQIFRMMDAMAEGKETIALDLYYDLLSLREPSMRILYLIGRQINQLLQVKELLASVPRGGRDVVASKCKVMPFVAGKLISQSRAFTKEQLRVYVEFCVEMEHSVKRGDMQDEVAVELVLLAIARKKTTVVTVG